MKKYYYDSGCPEPVVLCLGFFDCLHNGHFRLLERAQEMACACGAQAALFTFDNDPAALLKGESEEIFTLRERLYRMDELGVHIALIAHADRAFLQTEPEAFLRSLTSGSVIKGFVCGADHTFGAGGRGNADMLRKFCLERGILFEKINLKTDDNGEKIASRKIRELIKKGDMRAVNSLLPLPYIIAGTVVHGRREGAAMGFPTANINLPAEKLKPADGVYYTNTVLDGERYPCITNVGTHPTFADYSVNVETHIIGFDGCLYGREIVVEFMDKMRDIVKFDSKEEIAAQLAKDKTAACLKFENDKVRS